MALENNAFCWNGIVSTDPDKAQSFYAQTIGWNAAEYTFPNGETSTLFFAADFPRAHLRQPDSDAEPNHWNSYLRVEDVDASAADAEANGGTVLIPPTDIAPGRFAAVMSPSGAVLCLFHEADEASAQAAPAGDGCVHWTELQSSDVDADIAWLTGTFGFESEEMPIPDGTYYLLKSGGKPRGGAVAAFRDEVAGGWLSWIQVADVDAAVGRVGDGGGRVITKPSDFPGVGRMSIVSDPTGGVFGVITPSQT